MSQTKKLKSLLLTILTLFTFFVFGCGDSKVEVDNINVNLESQSQIILLVDDFFDLTGKVEVMPSYATDKTFSIYSLNENIVRIVGNKLIAEGIGETFVRVVSNSNENVEDVISVSVVEESIILDSPLGLDYDESLQTFEFNPVDNAASYTIDINGLETNLGNVTTFKLADYVGKKYNEVLSVKVRANAPSFGKAYVNSEYSKIIKIYQTEKVENVSIVGGKLNFANNSALVYDVYFNEIKMFSELSNGKVDLNALSEEFAGATKTVTIVSSPSLNTKQQINQAGVRYVSSTSDEILLNVLDEPEISMKGDVISWNAIPFADGYTVFIGSLTPIYCKNNYLDLRILGNYAQLGNTETKVKVVSNLSSNSKNLAKTTKESNEISFARLKTPIISVLENGFEWNSVANASAYFVEVKNGENIVFSASTNVTTFDLSKYGAGIYNIKVYALGNNDSGNYLSSAVANETITKHGEISASISDYVLNISTISNENYLLTIDGVQFGNVITAQDENTPVELLNENFTAGLHTIKIKRLGNGTDSVDGIETLVTFTQLEAEIVSINKSIAAVEKSEINQNANITLEISGGALVNPIVVSSESYEFNTTVSGSDFLQAGNYSIVAYVNGDGSSTFAYRGTAGGKNPVACEGTNFTVLAAPQIAIRNNGISWTTENAQRYNVQVENVNESKFEVNSENVNIASVDMSSYNAGKYYVKVRANGHNEGGNYVSSQISSVEIVKHAQVEASIEDYKLKITTTENEKYLVNFTINDNNTYTETLTASSNEIEIDLSGYNFKSGAHNISITQLGNADDKTINGKAKVVSFTQLEAAVVVISNSIASVSKSATNKDATIKLQISGGALTNVIDINNATYMFNTTNKSGENFLGAGGYRIVAFVVGDGSSTFSYRNVNDTDKKQAVACGEKDFTVLAVPGLEVLDKSNAEISVNKVTNAENYSILDENEQIIENVTDTYSFDLASGETKTFKVRANGNGSTTLSSLSSEAITVRRLTTPTITFYPSADASLNVQENSFKFDANNHLDYYDAINFYHNNTLINSYSAGSTFTSFVEGENKFKVDLISNGEVDGVYYINSFAHEIEVNKYYTASKIYTDISNNIVVENPNSEKLFIDLTINGVKYVDNESNQVVNGSVVLDYTYSSGKYLINIFNNKNIKIAGVNQGDNITVQAQFRRTNASNNVDSDISSQFSVNYLIAPKFDRDNQNIYFISSYEGYDLFKYNLIINGTKVVTMESLDDKFASEEVGVLTKYTIAMADLWNTLKNNGFNTLEVNSLAIQILNSATNEDNPILYAYGEEIYVQQAQTFEIKTEKIDGMTYVNVQTSQTDYEKSYVINVLEENEYTINDGSIISIPLDDKDFEGELNIIGYVKANSSYDNVFVFNSNSSSTLSILRLSTPELSVNNNTICYTTVSYATDYEVYELKEGVYVKVDETRLERIADGFRFNDLTEPAEITIQVKAITTNSQIVNSNFSEAITIKKIGKASASVINGQVGIKLPDNWQELVQNGVETKLSLDFPERKYECFITYNAEANTYLTSFSDITWSQSNDAFMVNSARIFNYNDTYIKEKSLKIGLELNGVYDGKHYLYSDIYTGYVKGLFAPTNVRVEKLNDYAERISWENNSKNFVIEDKTNINISINQYVFAFIYDGITYYSTDESLKYKTSTGFDPYGNKYTVNQHGYYSAPFPYGYDANNDDDFDDEGDIVFGEGDYNFMVAAYKDGFATSPYSGVYTFKVLSTAKVSIEDGKLKWDAVANATSYLVRIKDLTGTDLVTKEITTGLIYDFEDFSSGNEFYQVTVQAITTNSDMRNSKESEALMFYRLPVASASEIKIDDGLLKVTASPFAYAIDVIYGGKTYRFVNANQEENLNTTIQTGMMNAFLDGKTEIEEVKEYVMTAIINTSNVVYIMDLSTDYPELNGASDYEIGIRICGNTGVVYDANSISIGMVNSKTTTKNITAQVMKTNVNPVKAGVWQFKQNPELGETSKSQLNYNFNNVAVEKLHPFWLDTIVYKIEIAATSGNVVTNHIIYAVDYNRFVQALADENKTYDFNKLYSKKYLDDNSKDAQTYYELCCDKLGLYARIIYVCDDGSKLYFNVYLDNIYNSAGNLVLTGNVINLQDYDTLFYSPNSYDVSQNNNEFNDINLAAGGTYVVNIRTLGGDELTTNAYLSSPNIEQTFVRYRVNRASTLNGHLVIENLRGGGSISPIYKIGVRKLNAEDNVPWTYVYLYDAENVTEKDVIKFLKLPDDAICVPIDFVEGDTNLITFDMNEYFNPATYKVTVQTLAGIDADDWSLNAKAPGDEYTPADIYIFNSPKVEIVDGNIVFDSSSISVNGNDKYADKYEIIVTKDGDNEEYSAEIVVDYSNCIKDGTFIKYILPSEIEGLKIEAEKDYAFKIRAITTEQSCVNSKFTGNKQFTRETRVTNVVIDEGKLKWTASETGSYLIKITKVENNETIIITNGYERNGKVYTYEFKEQELPIWGKNTSTQINPNVNYTISVSKVGNNGENGNVISSSYEDKSNVYRIENVQNTEIKTEKGVLTWNKIEEAIGYQLKIIDNENTSNMYEYTIRDNVNSINLASVCYDGSENLLPAGNYKVQIRAIGGSKINSLLTVSDKEFIKLKSVESIKFKGDKITWDEIENAQGYIVKFGNSDESFKTTDAEISLPQYNGKLTITITTYGGDSIDLLNSNECEFITTTDNPESVQNLKYNYEENRFEWTADEFNEDTDIFVISYEFKKYGVDDSGDRTEEKSVFIEESTKDNFYYISKMGKYLNFTVVVRRTYREDVILDSSKQQYEEFSLALFICGAGTKGDPYVIQTQEMLSNMKYYPNAYYQINKDISISISIDDTETYTPAILNFEFAGYINGNNHKIDLGEINLTDVKEFALFTSLNGASITDLDISGNVKNDIKNQITGDVKIALLAINATNAKLENVRIVTSTISVEEYEDNNSNSYEIVRDDKKGEYGHLYVAGFFAVDNGSTLTNCDIAGDDAEGIKGLTINLDIDVEGDEYIGGISAKADKTQVVNGEFDVCITNGESLIMYVGGLFGYYTGDNLNNENCTINRTQVNITINEVKSLYVGGIVGFAQYVTIQDNKVSGQINYSSISNIYWYFGGIAGFVESGLIYNNTVSEDDINIKVDSVGDGLNIGLVVGYLGIDTNKSLTCELKGQYSQGPNPTDITIGTLKLGVYGKKAEGVDIDTSYTE